jgi:hypothetical protein
MAGTSVGLPSPLESMESRHFEPGHLRQNFAQERKSFRPGPNWSREKHRYLPFAGCLFMIGDLRLLVLEQGWTPVGDLERATASGRSHTP